jgi:hypothetical protein
MAVTALFATAATIIAERLGAIVGALVATLPVSAGPVYVFLALDHDATFISASAVTSLALNAATAIFVTVYVLTAQRRSLWVSMSLAFSSWLLAALALGAVAWTAFPALVFNVIVFSLCFFIVRPFCLVHMPTTTIPWYDFVLRAAMVALLVGAVVALSFRIGPTGSGVLAVFPIIYASIMLILHRRVGGPATAAVLAKCHSWPSWIWRCVANAASGSSAIWIRTGPHSRPWSLRHLQRCCLRGAAPPRRRSEKLATESLSLDLALLDLARCRQCGRGETLADTDRTSRSWRFSTLWERRKVCDHVDNSTSATAGRDG